MSDETSNKIALVTGANRGIGLETSRQLAKLGIHVLLGARDAAKGTEAADSLKAEGLDVEFILLDMNDKATHQSAAQSIQEKFGKLDILVNNAGIYLDEKEDGKALSVSRTTQVVLRNTFETNFFDVVALTQTLLPLVLSSDAGRLVFLSSALGSLTLHSDPSGPLSGFVAPAYDISKTALNAYVVHLALEFKSTVMKINAAHPGSVATDMNSRGDLSLEDGSKTSVALATLPADGPTGKLIYMGNELPW